MIVSGRLFAPPATGTVGLYKGVQLLPTRRPEGRKIGRSRCGASGWVGFALMLTTSTWLVLPVGVPLVGVPTA